MKCPECGNDWIADRAIVGVKYRKKWWHITPTVEPYHTAYPEKLRYHCIECQHEWGSWN